MTYWRRLIDLIQNCELKLDKFNLDIDGLNKNAIKSLIKGLSMIPLITEIKTYRNVYKYKHYHIKIKLNKEIEIWKILMLRMFFNDDCDRVRFDIVRLNKGILDTFDYIGDKKYSINFDTGEYNKYAEYRPIKI